MNYQQTKAALEIHRDREDRYAEQEWRVQLEQDRAARELRAENMRRFHAANRGH